MRTTSHTFRRIFAISAVSGLVFIALVYLLITSVAQSVEQHLATGRAHSYLDILRKTQSFYSSNIVANAKKNGVSIAKDFENKSNSIPFPATFMHGLVRELSLKEKNLDFRFFSPYPFFERDDSGFADKFEERAWNVFNSDSKKLEVSEVVSSGGTTSLRYALPVRMGEQCLGCHNSHPNSPRTDWKVGELRGIQAVTMPLNTTAIWSQGRMGRNTILLIGGLAILFVAFVCGLWLLLTRNSQLNFAKEKIEDLAMRDSLTGQFNRRYFLTSLNDRIKQGDETFAVIVIDLDHFKNINDVHGHNIGDAVLQEVAARLSDISEKFKIIARFGGDEFAILVDHFVSKDEVESLALRVVEELSAPYSTERGKVYTGSSLGITFYSGGATTEIDLLTEADIALLEAKKMGRGRYLVFDEKIRQEIRHGAEMLDQIRDALEFDQFELFYQPKFDIRSGKILGLEALLRWNHPERGFLMPDSIFPFAEDHGLIPKISNFVSNQVVTDLNRWMDKGLPVPPVAINLHRDYICDQESFFGFVEKVSMDRKLAELLVFEITEDCIIGRGNDDIMLAISAIKSAGIELSLDDFGTGYASLTHLKNLPVDEFKIDRSFVRDILDDPEDRAIVQSLIELSNSLDLKLVAEGIETNEQAEMLLEMGCRIGQGFLFSKPVNFENISHMMRSNRDALSSERVLASSQNVSPRESLELSSSEKAGQLAETNADNLVKGSGSMNDELPIIDWQALGSFADHEGVSNSEKTLRCLSHFQAQAPRELLKLAETATHQEPDDIVDAAQTLKALCQEIGARRVEKACDLLEFEARAGQIRELTVQFANLQKCLVEVLDHIKKLKIDLQQQSLSA